MEKAFKNVSVKMLVYRDFHSLQKSENTLKAISTFERSHQDMKSWEAIISHETASTFEITLVSPKRLTLHSMPRSGISTS
jgi:hypothetical protein